LRRQPGCSRRLRSGSSKLLLQVSKIPILLRMHSKRFNLDGIDLLALNFTTAALASIDAIVNSTGMGNITLPDPAAYRIDVHGKTQFYFMREYRITDLVELCSPCGAGLVPCRRKSNTRLGCDNSFGLYEFIERVSLMVLIECKTN